MLDATLSIVWVHLIEINHHLSISPHQTGSKRQRLSHETDHDTGSESSPSSPRLLQSVSAYSLPHVLSSPSRTGPPSSPESDLDVDSAPDDATPENLSLKKEDSTSPPPTHQHPHHHQQHQLQQQQHHLHHHQQQHSATLHQLAAAQQHAQQHAGGATDSLTLLRHVAQAQSQAHNGAHNGGGSGGFVPYHHHAAAAHQFMAAAIPSTTHQRSPIDVLLR